MAWPNSLQLSPLMEFEASLDPETYGWTRFGELRVFWVQSGSFRFMPESGIEGEGEVVDGASDWTVRSRDHYTMDLDVRGLLRVTSPEAAYIRIFYTGTVAFDDPTIELLRAGGRVPYENSAFITQPRFQSVTGDAQSRAAQERYARLDTVVSVAHGELDGLTLRYRIYEAVNLKNWPKKVPRLL